MNEDQPNTVVVRDNTGILLLLLLFVFVTMVLLTVTLIRLGTLDRKVGQLLPAISLLRGGGRRPYATNGAEFFYMR